MKKSKIQVFINYAKEDKEIAQKLYHDLKSAGLKPWMDTEDIDPGDPWRKITPQAIKQSSKFLLLHSANSLSKKGFVQKEIKIALEVMDEFPTSETFIIPIRLDECKPHDEKLQDIQWIDLYSDYQAGVEKILSVITKSPVMARPNKKDESYHQKASQTEVQIPTPLPAKPVKNWDEIFVGREDLVKKLKQAEKSYFVFGARRIGKTSLLKYIENIYWENKIPAFYIPIQGFSKAERIKRKIGLCFRKRQITDYQPLFEQFSFFELLEELDWKLEGRTFFLIDEAEQLTVIEKNENGFIDNFTNCINSTENIRFVFAASPHFKKEVADLQSSCSAFLSSLNNDILPVLTEHETYMLMKAFIPEISNEQIKHILSYTHYQPYLIKIFVSKLKQNGKLRPVSEKLAMETYNAHALEGILPNYFAGLSDDDQKIVQQIHRNQFRFDKKYEAKLLELTKYGYLKFESGEYQVSNWFFRHWLDMEYGG